MIIPGISYYLALLIKAEIGDANRSRDHLCSYASIVPLTHSSEGMTRHRRKNERMKDQRMRRGEYKGRFVSEKYNSYFS